MENHLENLKSIQNEIDELIVDNIQHGSDNSSLCDGYLGQINYLANRFSTIDDTFQKEKLKTLILSKYNSILNDLNHFKFKSSLMFGIGGSLNTYHYLVQNKLIDSDYNIERKLANYVKSNINLHNIDIFHGFAGALLSLNMVKSNIDVNDKVFLNELLLFINKSLQLNRGVYTWVYIDDIQNLGTAHGLPNLIYLSKYLSQITNSSICDEVYQKLRQTFLQVKSNNPDAKYDYSYSYSYNNKIKTVHRLSWCYCDLGIGIVLVQAAIYFKDKELYNSAVATLKKTVLLTERAETGIEGAGLCHGTFGVSYIYLKAYEYTNLPEFKNAHLFWLNESIRAFGLDPVKNFGLLDGLAGIGLVINRCLNAKVNTTWDRCLLLS